MAIEVAGKRFVTLADEFFVNGSKVYEAWANGVKVYPEIGPSYMKITTPPNKLVYKPGDTMDYTGIVCTLYNSDGTVFTDERYPDGTIPFEELEFPIEKAPAVGMIYVTDGIPGGRMEFPIPLYPIAYHFYNRPGRDSYIVWYYPDSDAYFVVHDINEHGIRMSCVSERLGAAINEVYEPPAGHPAPSRLISTDTLYVHDEKDAYYAGGTASLFGASYESFFPKYGSGPDYGYINGIDAWNILYGTREGDDSSIPVNWKSTYSGDDRTLTDKFNITNREVTS